MTYRTPALIALVSLAWSVSAQDAGALFRQAAQLDNGGAPESAVPLYAEAVRQGHAPSMVRLGYLLQNGIGTARDVAGAIDLYMRASNAGDVDGRFMLALANFHGVGVAKDAVAARKLLLAPAGAGHQYAQYLLAGMLESGEGGDVREAAARRWADKAAAGPDPALAARAAAMRDKIDEHMLAPDNHAGIMLTALLLVAFAGEVIQGLDGTGGTSFTGSNDNPGFGGRSAEPPPCRPVPMPAIGNSMTLNGSALSNPGQQIMMGGC
jgi:hypothetical protein